MGIHPDLLKNNLFADIPANWFIHAQGFHKAGLRLIGAKEPRPKKKGFSTEEVFHNMYSYKIAVYLLAHSVELAFKCLISSYNLSNKNKEALLKNPIRYSHMVTKMANDLIEIGVLSLNKDDYDTVRLIEEYLKWFGRYYCPQNINETIENVYTQPDENGLIEFKYKIVYPKTHERIVRLYDEIRHPKAAEANLSLQYLLYTP